MMSSVGKGSIPLPKEKPSGLCFGSDDKSTAVETVGKKKKMYYLREKKRGQPSPLRFF